MAEFKAYEESEGMAATRNPNKNAPLRVKRINQATTLSTDEWTHFNFSQVNGMIVREMAVDVEMRINDKESDPLKINPGDPFPGEINELWVRNAEPYPASLSDEHLVLWLNPSGQAGESIAPLMRDIYKNRYNYAEAENINALILELDTGLYGGSSIVEAWADIKSGYDSASTPLIQLYSSVSPLEDSDTITGPGGFRLLEQWDYEAELADSGSKIITPQDYIHLPPLWNSYRYVYLAIDFGEDSGSDLYGDCEIELTSTR